MLPTKLRCASEDDEEGDVLGEVELPAEGSVWLGCCAVGVCCGVAVLGDCMFGSCDGDDVL